MNLQNEKIKELCTALALTTSANEYSVVAQAAADKNIGYSEFLEMLLENELKARHIRREQMLLKMAR